MSPRKPRRGRHACSCGRVFTTPQGLGLHFKHARHVGPLVWIADDPNVTAKTPWKTALLAQRERRAAKK